MKTAIVTGASTGIGAAIVRKLLDDNWRVIGVARSEERLTNVHSQHKNQANFQPVAVDLSSVEDIENFATSVAPTLSGLDLLANVAGVWHDESDAFYGPLLDEIPLPQLLNVMSVGIVAPMLLCRRLIPLMFDREGAMILNLSGTFSSGGAKWVHYFVSKRALEELTVALADEYRPRGIRVNCLSPADTATDAYKRFFPEDAEDALTPEEVAGVAIGMYKGAEFRRVSGQVLEIRP